MVGRVAGIVIGAVTLTLVGETFIAVVIGVSVLLAVVASKLSFLLDFAERSEVVTTAEKVELDLLALFGVEFLFFSGDFLFSLFEVAGVFRRP